MADKEFTSKDFKTATEQNPRGMYVVTPKDRAMRAAQRATAMLKETLQGNANTVVTDAMRVRGVNVGFDEPAGPMDAVEKMKNGLARNSGKTKKQLFGGK